MPSGKVPVPVTVSGGPDREAANKLSDPLTTTPEARTKQESAKQDADVNVAQGAAAALTKLEGAVAKETGEPSKGIGKKIASRLQGAGGKVKSFSDSANKFAGGMIKGKKHENPETLEEIFEDLLANLLAILQKLSGGSKNFEQFGSILGPAVNAYQKSQAKRRDEKGWPKEVKEKLSSNPTQKYIVNERANLLQKHGVGEKGKPLTADEKQGLSKTEQVSLQRARADYHEEDPSKRSKYADDVKATYEHREQTGFKPTDTVRPSSLARPEGVPKDLKLEGNYDDDPRDLHIINQEADMLVKHGVEGDIPDDLSASDRVTLEQARADYANADASEQNADLKTLYEHKQAALEKEQKEEAAISEIQELGDRDGVKLQGDYSDPSAAVAMQDKMDLLDKHGAVGPLQADVPEEEQKLLQEARDEYFSANEDGASAESQDLKALVDARQDVRAEQQIDTGASKPEPSANANPAVSDNDASANANPAVSDSDASANDNPAVSDSDATANDNPAVSDPEGMGAVDDPGVADSINPASGSLSDPTSGGSPVISAVHDLGLAVDQAVNDLGSSGANANHKAKDSSLGSGDAPDVSAPSNPGL